MAGVAGPLWRWNHSAVLRFLIALLTGELIAGVTVGVVLREAGRWLGSSGSPGRGVALGLLLVLLGIADYGGRTPCIRRQVPQRRVNEINPVVLGMAWGLDLGLLFTTRKSTSLVWGLMLYVVLLDWRHAVVGMIAVACGSVVVVLVRTAIVAGVHFRCGMSYRGLEVLQRVAGSILVGAGGAALAVSSWGLIG